MLRKLTTMLLCFSLLLVSLPGLALGLKSGSESYEVVIKTGKAHSDMAISHPIFKSGNEVRFGGDVALGKASLLLKANIVIENDLLTIKSATIRQAAWTKDVNFFGEIPKILTEDTGSVYWGKLELMMTTDIGLEEGVAAIYFNPKKPQDTVVNISLGTVGQEHDIAVLLFGEPTTDMDHAVNSVRHMSEALDAMDETTADFQILSVPPKIEATHVFTMASSFLGKNVSPSNPPSWDICADGYVHMTNIFERSPYTNGNGHGYVDVRVFTDTIAVQRYLGPNYDGRMPFVDTQEIFYRISSNYIGVTEYYPLSPSQKNYSILGLIPTYGTYIEYFANTVSNLFPSMTTKILSSPGGIEFKLYNLIDKADFTYRDRNGNWISKSRSEEAISGGAFVRLYYNEGSSGLKPIKVETKVVYLASVNQSWIYLVTPTLTHEWNTNMAG